MPVKTKKRIGTMTENLGRPNEKVTDQFGPETTEESESERIKRLAPAGSNLARTTMVTRGGTRFIEEMPPESFKEGLMGSLTGEKKEAMQQEQQLMQEQLAEQQDLSSQQKIESAMKPTTFGGVVGNIIQREQEGIDKVKKGDIKAIYTPIKIAQQEIKALVNRFGRLVGVGRTGLSSAEITSRYDQTLNSIEDSLSVGGDPLNAEQLLRDIEQDLAQTASSVQIESKYDIGALIDGRLTDDQVKLAGLQRKINFIRMRIRMNMMGAGGR